jgi:hypothetical protein
MQYQQHIATLMSTVHNTLVPDQDRHRSHTIALGVHPVRFAQTHLGCGQSSVDITLDEFRTAAGSLPPCCSKRLAGGSN